MAFNVNTAWTVAAPPADFQPFKNHIRLYGAVPSASILAARVGAYALGAAADSGTFTTAATLANATSISALALTAGYIFGRGPGNWIASDVDLLDVQVYDFSNDVQGGIGQISIIYVAELRLVGVDLQIGIHNKGAAAPTVAGAAPVYATSPIGFVGFDITWKHSQNC